MESTKHRGFYNRGYLPHVDCAYLRQFVTFRLADSLPRAVLDHWKHELATIQPEAAEVLLRKRVEKYLDSGFGSCILKEPPVRLAMANELAAMDETWYRLLGYCLMPNHVHLVFEQKEEIPLGTVMRRLKSQTSRAVNKAIGRTGPLWQLDYFDRFVRDARHMEQVMSYVVLNPVKAGLVSTWREWPGTWLRSDWKDYLV